MVENYGKVLDDCGRVLRGDGGNVKALYRSARACFALDKLDEAEDAITRAIAIDQSNKSFQSLLSDISKRRGTVTSRTEEMVKKEQHKRDAERTLKAALKVLPHPDSELTSRLVK
jgi:tetratricopeptide (TPR) repeat protein